MKQTALFFGFILAQIIVQAQTSPFDVSLIPDSLKTGANVVVRNDSIVYQISSPGKATMERYSVFTILNKHGDSFADISVLYDQDSKVNSISGEIYDARGERVRKIKTADIADNSLVSDYTLFQDDRYKSFTALHHTYPYTIVAEYKVTYDGFVSLNRWIPVSGYKVSVEKSSFTVKTGTSPEIRFLPVNIPSAPEIKETSDGKLYHWQITGIKAMEYEPYSPYYSEILPILWSAPDKFEYEGTSGEFTSWKNFGKWQCQLNEGKQELPEATVQKIKELTSGAADDKEKARILYGFFQNKTRYVSIQLGIGGWEPFAASVVDKVGYGDCKALSNYMMSILKVAGIKSYYTVIGNGSIEIRFPDFPCMGQANHVILCVPFENDTTWLECTSQEMPFGFISKSNSNRYALLITPEGGVLAKTPYFAKETNLQERSAKVVLDDNGSATAEIKTCFSGLQFENRFFLLRQSTESQKKWLLKNLELSSPVLTSFKFEETTGDNPSVTETLETTLPSAANLSGQRLFLRPNLMNCFSKPPAKLENRRFPIEQEVAFTDIDSVKYIIPEGYSIEALPQDEQIRSDFGSYATTLTFEGNILKYTRRIEIYDGLWPAGRYNDFRDFYTKIWKADQSNAVFVKK